MPEEHIFGVMERTHAQKQERFVHLFIYTSPHLAELRKHKELAARVADICSQVAHELMPEQVTSESYGRYAATRFVKKRLGGINVKVAELPRMQTILTQRLMENEPVRAGITSAGYEVDCCNGIAYLVSSVHHNYLQRQLMPRKVVNQMRQENISRYKRQTG